MNSGPARRAARERVLRHLLEHVSGLDRDTARAFLVAANADRSNGLRRLDAHLTAEPDALTSGSATVPPSLFRLLVLLERAGHPVTVPSCPGCGQRRAQLPGSSGSGRICQSCAAKQRARSCARCGRTATVAATSPDGPICASCYARDTDRHEHCAGCGHRRKVNHRRGDGTPLCSSCHKNPIATCPDCGGASRRVQEAEQRPLCSCGRPGRIRACARCGHERAVVARWPVGDVCRACYRSARDHPAPCPRCAASRVLVAADAHGTGICGPCAGVPDPYTCRECGGTEPRYRDGRCARCVLRARLSEHFGDPITGTVPENLRPLLAALVRAHRPRSVLAWLARDDGSAALLRRLGTTGTAITHGTLDGLEPRPAVVTLRQMLVHVGVLPVRHEPLDGLPAWLERKVATVPAHHRQLVRAYGSWSVLRRARHRVRRTTFTAASAGRARSQIALAVTFLRWLDTHGIELPLVGQSHVEHWLSAGTLDRRRIGDFLRWTRQRGLTTTLTVTPRRQHEPDLSMTDQQRWELLRRCLHDTSIPLNVRAAGSVLLLYGLPVSRIAALRAQDLVSVNNHPHLLIEGHRTQLPATVGALLQEAGSALTSSAVGRVVDGDHWLFPSSLPGRPISAAGLTRKLNQHHIPVRLARNAALVSLASDLPAAALSGLLGISISNAVQWTQRAKRDWHAFVQARVALEVSTSTVCRSVLTPPGPGEHPSVGGS